MASSQTILPAGYIKNHTNPNQWQNEGIGKNWNKDAKLNITDRETSLNEILWKCTNK